MVRARKRARNSRTICDTEEVGMITRLSICIKGTSYLRAQKERKKERGDSAHATGMAADSQVAKRAFPLDTYTSSSITIYLTDFVSAAHDDIG